MSGSVQVTRTAAVGFVAAIKAAELPLYNGTTTNYPAETVEQFHAVKKAAIGLFESGCVGPTDRGYYTASLSGHSNPGHAKTPGWANDMVGCYVNQADPPTESED